MLNKQHKEKRLEFAYWACKNPELYDSIVWSDESLKKVGKTIRNYVWVTKGVNEWKQFINMPGAQRFSTQVWGQVLLKPGDMRVRPLRKLNGRQNTGTYMRRMTAAFEDSDGIYDGNIYQQDNAPYHVSGVAKTFLRAEIKKLNSSWVKWPPRSPCLSPIEYIWGAMDRWMDQYKARINTQKQWDNLVALAWKACTTQECLMRYHIRGWAAIHKCIKNGGGNKWND